MGIIKTNQDRNRILIFQRTEPN